MEISTILLIYIVVAFVVSTISTVSCVIEGELGLDHIIGIIILSLLWPVMLVPFLVMLLFNNIKYKDNK